MMLALPSNFWALALVTFFLKALFNTCKKVHFWGFLFGISSRLVDKEEKNYHQRKNIGFWAQEPNFAWKDSKSKVHVFWLSNIAIIQGIFLVMKFSLNSIKFFENIELEAFSRCLIE